MFGFFKNNSEVRHTTKGVKVILLHAFRELRGAVSEAEIVQKRNRIFDQFTSLTIALHDEHPNFPLEKSSLSTLFIATYMENHPDLVACTDAIEKHILGCPEINQAKLEFVTYLLAPKYMKAVTDKRRLSK